MNVISFLTVQTADLSAYAGTAIHTMAIIVVSGANQTLLFSPKMPPTLDLLCTRHLPPIPFG